MRHAQEVIDAEEEEENAGRPDREQDVKPFMQSAKARRVARLLPHTHACAHALRAQTAGVSGDGDGENEDDGGDDGEAISSYTLRKSSASSLDVLSTCFPTELLPVLLPIVDVRLRESDWRLRESAILALGAVAEGCDAGLSHLAPQIIQGLLPVLDDPRPLVRATYASEC